MQEEVKRLRALADRAAGVTKDRVAARDALALGRQLAQLDATPEEVSSSCPCLMDGRRVASCGDCTQSTPVELFAAMATARPYQQGSSRKPTLQGFCVGTSWQQ